MAVTQRLMTAAELSRLPDDGQRHELIGGELRTMAPSGAEHSGMAALHIIVLGQHVLAHDLGRVYSSEGGYLLTTNPDTVRAPDASFITRERVQAAGRVMGYWRGAPDLAIEVISPSDLYTEVEEKVATWLAHGTRMMIVLNPRRRTATVHHSPTDVRHLAVEDTLDGGDIVPGWRVPVRDLFLKD